VVLWGWFFCCCLFLLLCFGGCFFYLLFSLFAALFVYQQRLKPFSPRHPNTHLFVAVAAAKGYDLVRVPVDPRQNAYYVTGAGARELWSRVTGLKTPLEMITYLSMKVCVCGGEGGLL
jgi:hypothetical protein